MAGGLSWFGDGEHARVVAACAAAAGWTLHGPVDEAGVAARRAADPAGAFLLAMGDIARRRDLAARLPTDLPWAVVVHPSAVVAADACLGPGTLVGPLALVHVRAAVGAHAIINSGALIEHDVEVGPFTHCAPGVAVGGGARLGAGCRIGLGARLRDHITVGDGAVVGMGAVVVGPVRPGATVLGCPAREAAP